MRKKSILSLFILCLIGTYFMICGFTFFKRNPKTQKVEVKQEVVSENNTSDVWCITFQLIWNELMDKLQKPVVFVGGNPELANELNKKLYTKDLISEKSYYLADGKISQKLKSKIEKDIYKKFKEKSDILDKIDWNAKETYLFYAMLKKDFLFLTPFDKLPNQYFNSKDKVKYFGINKKSNHKLYKNVDVVFYNNRDDFAVKLNTKENEEVILYRTDKQDSFENLYKKVNKKYYDEFGKDDILEIPNIDVNKLISYDVLCGKRIVGTNYVIGQALQTIKFKLDDKGGTLKSEAAMTVMKTSMPIIRDERYFIFNKPFVLFLREKGKDKPYYAMRIEDAKYLVK